MTPDKYVIVTRTEVNLTQYPLHAHPCWEILYYTKNSGVLLLEQGETIPFQEGTVICVPPYVGHGSRSEGIFENICVQELHFPEDLRNAEGASIGSGGCIVFRNTGVDLLNLFRLIFRTYVESVTDSTVRIQHLMVCVYDLLREQVQKPRSLDWQVEMLKNDILEHFTDPNYRSIDSRCSYRFSPGYIRSAFREQCQMTPNQYLGMLRLRNAAALLQTSGHSLSIAEIAYASGFSDPLYFSKCFRAMYHVSPQVYRETCNAE